MTNVRPRRLIMPITATDMELLWLCQEVPVIDLVRVLACMNPSIRDEMLATITRLCLSMQAVNDAHAFSQLPQTNSNQVQSRSSSHSTTISIGQN